MNGKCCERIRVNPINHIVQFVVFLTLGTIFCHPIIRLCAKKFYFHGIQFKSNLSISAK